MPSPSTLLYRSSSSFLENSQQQQQQREQEQQDKDGPPKRTDPVELRERLEEFFDRLSLSFSATEQQQQQQRDHEQHLIVQEGRMIPWEVQFEMLVQQYDTTTCIPRALLMVSVSDDPSSDSYTGRLPIHLACDRCAPRGVIAWLVRADRGRASIRTPDRWGDLPLHTACSRRNYQAVIRLLIEADPTTILVRDRTGLLPLHMACRYNSPAEVIELLLKYDPRRQTLLSTCPIEMGNQLPIHMAVRCDAPAPVVRVLLQADHVHHTTTAAVDAAGRLALHVAFLRNASVEVIHLIMDHMLVGRMERVGIDAWKRDVRRFIAALEDSYERDFLTREKCNLIIASLRDMMERVVLLELAVWRCSCLRILDDLTVPNMDDLSSHVNDVAAHKRQRRITGGIEAIALKVVPFLEGEPMERYQQEFPETSSSTTPWNNNTAARPIFPVSSRP